jgi:orotate phosphoribosyltransferase
LGNSSPNAVEALKEAGAKCKGMLAIFSYGFDVATENFKMRMLNYTASNYEHL